MATATACSIGTGIAADGVVATDTATAAAKARGTQQPPTVQRSGLSLQCLAQQLRSRLGSNGHNSCILQLLAGCHEGIR